MRSPEWLMKKPFAHRGLHSGKTVPENSLLAVNRAVERGYGIELDVQYLADGGGRGFPRRRTRAHDGTAGADFGRDQR